ncbi:MAG: hypothetical protein IT370_24035 [Deltaproteobacteria bacterium]|nr:hypothetical protein [Deltaproteobacteria bacterium]
MKRAAALALLLVACAGARKDKGERPTDGARLGSGSGAGTGLSPTLAADAALATAAAGDAGAAAGRTDMMTTLKSACELLSRKTLTVSEAVAGVGTLERDLGGRLQVIVKPHDPAFAKAQVTRLPEGDTPAGIDFEVATPGALTVAALGVEFGAYKEPPRIHPDSPYKVIFKAGPGCSVVAVVQRGAKGVADGVVPRLTLRRDVL